MNRAATIDRVEELTERAVQHGGQLVAFPEAFVPGTPIWIDAGRYGRERLVPPGFIEEHGPWIEPGNTVVGPRGAVLAGQVREREETVVAELDLAEVASSRRFMDPTGHYNRPDTFRLLVDLTSRKTVTAVGDLKDGEDAQTPCAPRQGAGVLEPWLTLLVHLPRTSEVDMGSLGQRLWKAGNVAAVWMYRRTGGKVGGRARGGSLVLLLTVAGRKSGVPHTVPVAYVERDGAYYLAATAGGQPKEPQWIRNLRAASTATVEVGRERKTVSVEVLSGAECDAAWKDVIVATYPSFGPYESKSGRKIAVARLSPTT